jgi:geranylgeranyl pyrophosphate synthase
VIAEFGRQRVAVDAALAGFCDRYLAPLPPLTADAVRYALMGEGKRMRPMLVLAAHAAAGGRGDATRLAAAVEVVHAYSLVHDDLPCMDDDDVRRGRPTVHRVYGVPAATAAGLTMVPLAARCALDAAAGLGLAPAVGGQIVRELMRASGAGGMIGGQQLDLEGEGMAHSLAALGRYGEAVGLAFQIADDVLDVTATTHELGKTAGRDIALAKSTYPALLGVDGAMQRARALADQARETLDAVGLLTPTLAYIAEFSVARRS